MESNTLKLKSQILFSENDQKYREFLEKVTSSNVFVVAIIGPFRIGKSVLANILSKELCPSINVDIFENGPNMQPLTKGVHYCIISGGNREYVIIDCEGTDAQNDSTVFNLNLLVMKISNVVLFNVSKAFSNDSYQTSVTKLLTECETNQIQLPEMHFVIRDSGERSIRDRTNDRTTNLEILKANVAKSDMESSKFFNFFRNRPYNIFYITSPDTRNGVPDVTSSSSLFMIDLKKMFAKINFSRSFTNNLRYSLEYILSAYAEGRIVVNRNCNQSLQQRCLDYYTNEYSRFFNGSRAINYTQVDNYVGYYHNQFRDQIYNSLFRIYGNLIDPIFANSIQPKLNNDSQTKLNNLKYSINQEKVNYEYRRENSVKFTDKFGYVTRTKEIHEPLVMNVPGITISGCVYTTRTENYQNWEKIGQDETYTMDPWNPNLYNCYI